MCTYCCKVVLSYLQSNNLAADVVADLVAIEGGNVSPSTANANSTEPPQSDVSQNQQSNDASKQPYVMTPRGTLRRRPSLGFQEEKYVSRTRYQSDNFDAFEGQKCKDMISTERQLLLHDQEQLHILWTELISEPTNLPLGSHRHRLKSFPNSFVGKELVVWLTKNNKASSTQSAIAIGQALLEGGFLVCLSQMEQVFMDDYIIYRPVMSIDSKFSDPNSSVKNRRSREEPGQEPLWVKQLFLDNDANSSINEDKSEIDGKINETRGTLVSSSSNYSVDMNLHDNVVSVKKPSSQTRRKPMKAIACPYDNPPPHTQSDYGFTTSVSAALSASAVPIQPSSGVDSTAFMSEEVLRALQDTEALNPQVRSSGWHQMQEATSEPDNQKKLAQLRLNSLWSGHESALLSQLLSSAGLSSSWADIIKPIVHTVTDIVRPDVKHDSDDMDIKQYVQFKKIPGGARTECQIVNGAVCSKNVADRFMASRLTDPQILLLSSNIDYQRGDESKLLVLENVLLQEADYLKNIVNKITSYKPNIVLVEKSVAYLAKKYLLVSIFFLVKTKCYIFKNLLYFAS